MLVVGGAAVGGGAVVAADVVGAVTGEHPDWDEYRQAMVAQGKSLLRLTIDRWGPIATGGFPAHLAGEST